jgi:hypothetical protein
MKFIFDIRSDPESLDVEDSISNLFQDDGMKDSIETIIEQFIEKMMGFWDLSIHAELEIK